MFFEIIFIFVRAAFVAHSIVLTRKLFSSPIFSVKFQFILFLSKHNFLLSRLNHLYRWRILFLLLHVCSAILVSFWQFRAWVHNKAILRTNFCYILLFAKRSLKAHEVFILMLVQRKTFLNLLEKLTLGYVKSEWELQLRHDDQLAIHRWVMICRVRYPIFLLHVLSMFCDYQKTVHLEIHF